ncbi:RNA polymerase, sigma-24 subunit, ECF subfamily [Parvibaculum lavamentivorans DS-1]|uniref:RNA polymerase sigma factor n=1 Tax=Parvibaculum lavamentivorans (strain DS-1 / DSM 13023 / NCIMB 13966) TaxID=402881 RepID=A7HRP1_PARL1|nr:RNA polymerase, sigma-24 subunit, ECF subfamily [Parvibaculum lavamentivorans DS-1]
MSRRPFVRPVRIQSPVPAAGTRGCSWLDEPSDDELVAAVALGDEAACRELMNRHLPRITALGRRMLGSQADAEDVAQEVFLRVWTNAGKWEPGRAQFSTWLHRVATNLCLDRLRKNRGGTEDIDAIPEPASEEPGPDRRLEQSELAERVEAALQALPERQRAAIVLSHYQGLTNIEAAEILGITVEAVESLLSRARRQLRGSLATEKGELLRSKDMST